MTASVKGALKDAGITPESVEQPKVADAQAPAQEQAPQAPADAQPTPPTLAEIADAQAKKGGRLFTLAPGTSWVHTGNGKVGATIRAGTTDVYCTYVPSGGKVVEVPIGIAKVLCESLFLDKPESEEQS